MGGAPDQEAKMAKPKINPTNPAPAASTTTSPKGKLGTLVNLLSRPEGATLEAMQAATAWQAHSIRGAIAGAIKKKLGQNVLSEKIEGQRRYRIAEVSSDAG
jgi:hypothetical protein